MDNLFYYLKEGFTHISDIGAYDHILFITAMAALYSYKEWKPLLWLVTAFTIGHSIALALATFEIITINSAIIEFLIPVTIILTCIWNIIIILKQSKTHPDTPILDAQNSPGEFVPRGTNSQKEFHVEQMGLKYSIVTFFGLIHGLGFSNYLRFMLASDETITIPLLMFNIGLEIGQILILTAVLAINFLFLNLIKFPNRNWTLLVSVLVIVISIPILLETGQALFN